MTSEYILLLVLSVFLLEGVVRGVSTTFQEAVPKLSVRLEKHLVTGHVFTVRAQQDPTNARVKWE